MTERTLYARVIPTRPQLTAALAFGLFLTRTAEVAAQAPCATCIAISAGIEQVAALAGDLAGMDVLIRVEAGKEAAAAAGFEEVERKGGRAGLLIQGIPAEPLPSDVLGRTHRILIDIDAVPSAAGQEMEQFVFTLKKWITGTRAGAPPGIAVGLAGAPAPLSALLASDLLSYVDFVVWSDAPPAGVPGHELWRVLDAPATPASVPVALAATSTPGVNRWLWRMPADARRVSEVTAALSRALTAPAAAAPDAIVESVQVVGSRVLTVEEIVARHQAAAARQAAMVRALISRGTLTLSFEAPGFPAPIAISSQAIIYAAGPVTELEQRAVRVNGIEFKGGGVPRLPIIEPERVASPPLSITLTGVYRYHLAGREAIGRTSCYIVEFEPTAGVAGAAPLFRGRAWIAMDSFAMVKVSAAQTGLRGPIVASEQVDEFREERGGVWLLARSDVRQTYDGAAHRTPIHRVLSIVAHEINPPDFAARKQAAYASDSVMLRDTPQGYRYLRKDRGSDGAVQTTIAGRADRVRTFVAGVILDPNISVPLPFAGLSYVDFNLFGTGSQLNAFFGGSYGQLAFSVPSLGRRRWQLAGRAFGIASSYNDRAFVNGRERYDEDIRQRPAQASIWLLRPLTPRISVRIGYDLDYTHFAAADGTAAAFSVPADQLVHGGRLALDLQRDGWNASAWWNPARRSGWRAWGRAGSSDYNPAQRDFQRYGASVVRSAVLAPAVVARVEAAWMSGHDLDRFSRYAFGAFDNRLRGYPSALIRYDRGVVGRSALAWAPGRFVRLDGFFDSAAVRDPGFGRGVRNYTGIGGALEAPAPFGTLIAVEWGYGLRGVNTNGSLGTQVVRVSGYKVF